MIWDTAERLVNRSTLIENSEDAKKIMRAPSKHKSLHRLKSMDGQVNKILNCCQLINGMIHDANILPISCLISIPLVYSYALLVR